MVGSMVHRGIGSLCGLLPVGENLFQHHERVVQEVRGAAQGDLELLQGLLPTTLFLQSLKPSVLLFKNGLFGVEDQAFCRRHGDLHTALVKEQSVFSHQSSDMKLRTENRGLTTSSLRKHPSRIRHLLQDAPEGWLDDLSVGDRLLSVIVC